MRNSNMIVRVGVLWGCGLIGPLCADDLTLDGGARLTGTVRSINEAGVVELASELSPEPVLLKRGTVEKVEFKSKGAAPKSPDALIELVNGDQLPVTIEALDARQLTVMSPEAGRLEIPRESLKTLQLGVRMLKVAYAGPRSLDEWTHGEGDAKNWVFVRHGLIANGPAIASAKLALPQQFSLRFTLKWQAKQIPNFQIYFADPLKEKGALCDRYYLQFGGAGLEIKREAAKGKRWITIVQLGNRNPNDFPDQQLQVEIKVDRNRSLLHLILNGKIEGDYIDPIPAVPDGSGITLVCNTQNGSPLEIRDIEVLEYDDVRDRQKSEERGEATLDALLTREDERWGGQLREILKTGDGQIFRFLIKHEDKQDDELKEIPAAYVSTVFFAAKDGAKPDDRPHPFVLRLRGEGVLRVTSCVFNEETVSAVHPLLGPLNFRREAIVAMERTDSNPKPAPEP